MIVQFHFRCTTDLYDWSRHCPISSLSYTTHCPIGLDSQVLYSRDITLVRSVTSLSCLLFVINCILFDRSRQLSSNFGVDCTYMISQFIVLPGLRHKPQLDGLVITIQFHFWHRAKLYDRSRQYPILSSSQTEIGRAHV